MLKTYHSYCVLYIVFDISFKICFRYQKKHTFSLLTVQDPDQKYCSKFLSPLRYNILLEKSHSYLCMTRWSRTIFFLALSMISSSTLDLVTSRYTFTCSFWPILCTLAWACSLHNTINQSSEEDLEYLSLDPDPYPRRACWRTKICCRIRIITYADPKTSNEKQVRIETFKSIIIFELLFHFFLPELEFLERMRPNNWGLS